MGSAKDTRLFDESESDELSPRTTQERTDSGSSERGFTIYWVCEEHRVPLDICQSTHGGDGSWRVTGGGYTIITIYVRSDGYYYHDVDFGAEDIQAIVDAITEFTGEGYKPANFYQLGQPGPIARYPPYFEPVFRDAQAEQSYYRVKLKDAQLRQKSKEQLQIIWRR